MLVPALLASSAGQLNALIDTILASMLLTGSIAWLYYADRLLELPIGLVAVALGTVLLPSLSRLAGQEQRAAFSRTLDWGLRMGVLLGLPASMALALLAEPLIATIFLHGEMTAIDAAMASLALRAFACGALPLVLVKILAPAFFADKDTRTPLRFALIAIGVNVALNLSLLLVVRPCGGWPWRPPRRAGCTSGCFGAAFARRATIKRRQPWPARAHGRWPPPWSWAGFWRRCHRAPSFGSPCPLGIEFRGWRA